MTERPAELVDRIKGALLPAVELVTQGPEHPVPACAHQRSRAETLVLCSAHPAAGVMCIHCAGEHFERHERPAPMCTGCGDAVLEPRAFPMPADGINLRAVDSIVDEVCIRALVRIAPWYVCDRCFAVFDAEVGKGPVGPGAA